MLSESLRVPYRADDASGTILVGSVLTLLSVVFLGVWIVLLVVLPPVGLAATPIVGLPSLVMRGYLLGVVDSGIHDSETVKSFVGWGSLVRAGSKSMLVSAVYLLPGAVLCGLAVGGGVATAVSPPGFGESLQALTGVVILIAGFGLLIYGGLYLYVRPAARAVFAATDSLSAAFAVRRVVRLASTADYLTGWLIATGLVVVGPTVALPLGVVAIAVGYLSPVVALLLLLATVLLGIGLLFVFRVSAAWATGRGATEGLRLLYPTVAETVAVDPKDVAETPTESAEATATAELAPNRNAPEASSAVQTGRTVEQGHSSQPAETEQSTRTEQPAASVDSDTDGTDSVAPADDDSETVDPEDGEDSETVDPKDADDSETVDSEESEPESVNDGFVWGVEDDQ